MLEICLRRSELQTVRHFAEFGLSSRPHHDGFGGAADNVRAQEQRVGPLAEARFRRKNCRLLLGRKGFPGQGRFVDKQILRLQDQAITGNGRSSRTPKSHRLALHSQAGTSISWPSRKTLALVVTIASNFCNALAALCSCQNPNSPLIRTITRMITASVGSRRKKERAAAPIKISVIGLLN